VARPLTVSATEGRPRKPTSTTPVDVAVDSDGSLFISDSFASRVRKVDPSGIITTIAGTGTPGYSGDGGPATAAQLDFPYGIELQGSGNLFVTEYNNHTVRRIDAAGIIDTVAGTGVSGFGGDGGYGPDALLVHPVEAALDSNGRLYIADADDNRVRVLETSHLWIRSAPAQAQVGQSLVYDMAVSGLPVTATGVSLTSTLPSQLAVSGVEASQGSCRQVAATVTCDLGTVEPGTVATMRVTVNPLVPGVIPVTATFSGDPSAAIPGPRASTTYTRVSHADCGRVITGTTTLTRNIGPCATDGLVVGADGITLNLGRQRVFGFDGAGSGNEAGIRVTGKTGVQILNGTVSGFDAGVVLDGGGSHTVSNLTTVTTSVPTTSSPRRWATGWSCSTRPTTSSATTRSSGTASSTASPSWAGPPTGTASSPTPSKAPSDRPTPGQPARASSSTAPPPEVRPR